VTRSTTAPAPTSTTMGKLMRGKHAFYGSVMVFLLLLLLVAVAEAKATTSCGHAAALQARGNRPPRTVPQSTLGTTNATTRGKRFYSDTPATIRITYDYRWLDTPANDGYACKTAGATVTADGKIYTCTTSDILIPAQRLVIKKLLETTRNTLMALLQVAPIVGDLALPADSYDGGIVLSDDYSVSNTDLVVFVTARPSSSSSTLATGIAIAMDSYGRPIAGAVNFCPSKIATTATVMNTKLMEGVALHEMIHVLGFSSDMFDSFVDGDGNTRANVIASTTSDQRPLAMLATPKVTAFVREHFGCASLAGAVLEDQGGTGTAGSHWEKASFMDGS